MSDIDKPDCKYWSKCYQRNPAHHAKYRHPPNEEDTDSDEDVSTQRYLVQKRKRSPNPGGSSEQEIKKKDQQSKREVEDNNDERKSSEQIHSKNNSIPREELSIQNEYNEVMKLASNNFFVDLERQLSNSYLTEYQDMLKTPEVFIRHKFLVEMPKDFYQFWEFCKSISKPNQKPENVFEALGLKCVGPFEVLAGKFDNAEIREPANYLRHWRFFYDPPEFQTVFVKTNSCIHYGYWRDDPNEKELLMARNDSNKNCEFQFIGASCFETILYYLDKDVPVTPFNRGTITNLKKSVEHFASEKDIKLNQLDALRRKRERNVVCRTFHKAGIVVPFDRKTELGYRNLIETDAGLKKILSKFEYAKGDKPMIDAAMEELQPIITAANIAVDECDFGTTIELGIDLFCSGITYLHDVIRLLLVNGYSLLHRPQFIAILKSHLEERKQGYNLSILK